MAPAQGRLLQSRALSAAFNLKLRTRLALIAACAGVVGVPVLLLYDQPFYPQTWLDEGFVLQGALSLVRHGQYAMWSSEGFRLLDQPLIANGPGNDWVDKSTVLLQLREPVDLTYDPASYGAEYLIDGWFSKWTGLYQGALPSGCCERIGSVGEYDLYRVRGNQ